MPISWQKRTRSARACRNSGPRVGGIGFSIVMQEGKTRSGFDWRLAPLANPDDLIEDALCHFPLGGLGHFDDFVVSNDGDLVAVRIEADAFARDIVDYNGVELLGRELLTGVFEDVLGFCGKADDNLGLLALRNL